MRVLADLGTYDIGKPLVVNRGVLDTMEKLLEAPGSHDHVHSPLDVIDPMLYHFMLTRPHSVPEDFALYVRSNSTR